MVSARVYIRIILEMIAIVACGEVVVVCLSDVIAPRVSGMREAFLHALMLTTLVAPVFAWRLRAWVPRLGENRSRQAALLTIRSALIVLPVLALGLLATVLATAWQMHASSTRVASQFETLTDRVCTKVRERMGTFVYGLKGTRGILMTNPDVDRRQFVRYARSRDVANEFPGALGMGFIQRVPASQKEAFVEWMNSNASPGFQVHGWGEGEELFVIKYIEPLAPNRQAWGLDVASEPARYEAAVRAMLTGEPTLTGPIQLVQDQKPRAGFLYYVPVYRGIMLTETPETRRAACIGWTYMPITAEDALAGVLDITDGMLTMDVFDGDASSDASRLVDGGTDRGGVHQHTPAMTRRVSMSVGGRTWTLVLSTTQAFDDASGNALPGAIAATGTILTLLLTGVVWSISTARTRAVNLAEAMTADLAAAKDSAEAALREVGALRAGLDQHAILSATDAQGRITDVNFNFCVLTGYTREELIGQNHRILNSGRHPTEFWTQVYATLANGRAWHGEVCSRSRDGELYWADTTIVPFANREGVIEKYIAIRFDITARKEAEEALTEISALQQAILDNAAHAIIAADPEGAITSFNRAAENMLGYTAEEMVGKQTPAVFHDPSEVVDRAQALSEELGREVGVGFETFVIKSMLGMRNEGEWTYVRRDSGRFPVMLSITAIRNAEGTISGYLGIAADITRQKRAEQQLLDARQIAEDASRAKSEFLANMSHEIRTPMTAILGFADLLTIDGDDHARRTDYVGTIKRNGQQLLAIINDILDISKIEAGRLSVERVATSPRQVVDDVANLMSVKAKEKGITLAVSYAAEVPDSIESDPLRLGQIVLNLVSNAIKFTHEGSVQIGVGYDEAASVLRIRVSDTGIGMVPEQTNRLFRAFEQGDASTTRRFGGTGLGLRISQRLAEIMGGGIVVRSVAGEGSTFEASVSARAIAVPKVENNPVSAAASPAPLASLAGVRVLLAEDGVDNRMLIAFHLRKAGAEVVAVENGREAVDALASVPDGPIDEPCPFDLLITDMQMPEMDGYAVAKWVRERSDTLPVIALTANAMEGDMEKCLAAGCNDYVPKPIDRRQLIRACARFVGISSATGVAA